jgi:phosphohistidine phosphatase
MKTFYLLRHAHAEPREQSLSDFDRPLDETGRRQAEAVAGYLKKKKLTFDFVMCSAALRTQETLEPLRPVIGTEAIEISEEFYNSPEDQILKHLKRISDERNRVLYIGHNPGIAFASLKFTKVFPEVLIEGVTPATLIGFQFPLDHWKDLEWWEGKVIDVFQPMLPSTEPSAPDES